MGWHLDEGLLRSIDNHGLGSKTCTPPPPMTIPRYLRASHTYIHPKAVCNAGVSTHSHALAVAGVELSVANISKDSPMLRLYMPINLLP